MPPRGDPPGDPPPGARVFPVCPPGAEGADDFFPYIWRRRRNFLIYLGFEFVVLIIVIWDDIARSLGR